MEFPDRRWRGRHRPFSRRNVVNTGIIGRDRYEHLVTALVNQGYLIPPRDKVAPKWTEKGRTLLMQLLAGRFGTITLYRVDSDTKRTEIDRFDPDTPPARYTVDVR